MHFYQLFWCLQLYISCTPYFTGVTSEVFFVCINANFLQMLTMQGFVVNKYDGHSKKVTHLSVSPHKLYFLSCSEDCTLNIWRIMESDAPSNAAVFGKY